MLNVKLFDILQSQVKFNESQMGCQVQVQGQGQGQIQVKNEVKVKVIVECDSS